MIVTGSLQADAKHARVQAFKKRTLKALIATDCLSYGQNLQEVQYVVNFDMHYNPAVMLQRNMRIDRGFLTKFPDLYIYNFVMNTFVEQRILKVLKPKVELSKDVLAEKTRQSFGFKGIVKLLEF